ncbi:unnamed protein product [Arabis nemorensis]|uniref:Uncharacterized protein n=1 Tax=Arabis nemorensis TaxID=586526 RepID=A0A565B9Z9_9BRAS|nr:unnamed protein product [Arabis nemorensis]
MISESEIQRWFPASPSAPEAIASFPSEMTGLVRSSPPLPPEPPDPPDRPASPPATSPPQSAFKALLLLPSRVNYLVRNSTRPRTSDGSRSWMWLPSECRSLRPKGEEPDSRDPSAPFRQSGSTLLSSSERIIGLSTLPIGFTRRSRKMLR